MGAGCGMRISSSLQCGPLCLCLLDQSPCFLDNASACCLFEMCRARHPCWVLCMCCSRQESSKPHTFVQTHTRGFLAPWPPAFTGFGRYRPIFPPWRMLTKLDLVQEQHNCVHACVSACYRLAHANRGLPRHQCQDLLDQKYSVVRVGMILLSSRCVT